MLQSVCSVVDHSWRQSVVRTKKWQSELCGLDVTISASCNWSVAIFTTSLESQESYLTLKNLTLQITRDFFRLHSTFAWLYNAAASPASRLRSAGSLAINIAIAIQCPLGLKHFRKSRFQLATKYTGDEALTNAIIGKFCGNFCLLEFVVISFTRVQGWKIIKMDQI